MHINKRQSGRTHTHTHTHTIFVQYIRGYTYVHLNMEVGWKTFSALPSTKLLEGKKKKREGPELRLNALPTPRVYSLNYFFGIWITKESAVPESYLGLSVSLTVNQ